MVICGGDGRGLLRDHWIGVADLRVWCARLEWSGLHDRGYVHGHDHGGVSESATQVLGVCISLYTQINR
jgi:hypothetical protein